MKTTIRRRILTTTAIASVSVLALAACGSNSEDGAEGSGDDGEITLTVATFNDFGYTDELFQEYEDANPGITIVHNRAATSNEARENYFQKLGSSGLADIEAIEVDWLPEVMKYSDLLVPVPEETKDRWLDWKVDAATDDAGNLIGYGTDIGPEAVCYRADLFAEAGLPTDRAEVAELLDGDWANYFAVGEQYSSATGKAWFDSAGGTYQGMVNQIDAAYEDPETGEILAEPNADVKEAFEQVLAASENQSAHLGQWSEDWYAGMSNGDFATMLCPGWMLTQIEGNAKDVTGWDIADVFPGGGGNWGGSYLTIPTQGKNQEAAQKLADWLTSPEIMVRTFQSAGTFPSQNDALEDPTLLEATNAYFNDAPIGEIFSARAGAITVSPFKGENYFSVNDTMQKAITRVEEGTQDADTSWDQWVTEVKALG